MLVRTSMAMLVALLLAACGPLGTGVEGSGQPREEARQVSGFDAVELGGAAQLEIRAQPATSCAVSADDNLVPLIRTEVRGGTLYIDTTERLRPRSPVVIRVGLPRLTRVAVSGAGEALIYGASGDSLDARISGAGKLSLFSLDLKHLAITLSGAASATASGQARALEFELSGAGSANLTDLCAEAAKVKLNGAGSAELVATRELEVEINGVGSVGYLGQPHVTPRISGAGSVKPLGSETRCRLEAAPAAPSPSPEATPAPAADSGGPAS